MRAFWLLLLLLAAPLARAESTADTSPIGVRIDNFELPDPRGGVWRLTDQGGRNLIVIVFVAADCPLAQAYAPGLNELAKAFGPRGVAFVGIDSNRFDSSKAIARFARQHRMTFPILKDAGNAVADRCGAQRNPEVFVLDRDRTVRYRGRIDDQYAVGGGRKGTATRADLSRALEELLAGRPVSQPVTEASGCLIARVGKTLARGEITYAKHIAPLLEKHCVMCHRAGQIAPFALTSYREVEGWSETIQEVLEQGRMPPWQANPKHGKFVNDLRLADPDKRLILDWIDNGCLEGERGELAPVTRSPDGWNIPTPDVVLTMPQPFTVPAEGIIEYQHFEVDPGFHEDKWIRAVEIRPGNRRVVHHCNIFLKPPRAKGPAEVGTLGSFCLAAMAPGTPSVILPDGMAKRIPAGWRLLFVVHYTAIGTVETDQTRVGLVFADPKTVKREVATKLMLEPDLCIPPQTADHRVAQTWHIHQDVLLLAMFPHMHLRGKSFRYEVAYPDGTTEILLDVPHYDFNWQHRYVLAEPKRLPAGSQITCTARYDNSKNNPANPDPTATVHAGPQSWDEMFNGYFDVVLVDQDLTAPTPWHAAVTATAQTLLGSGHALLALAVVGGCLLLRRRFRQNSATCRLPSLRRTEASRVPG